MTTSLRLLGASALLVLSSTVSLAASPAPGYVDFGKFAPAEDKQFVEIELDGNLLKLAAKFAGKENAEIAQVIANLERVRVNVMGLPEETRSATLDKVQSVRETLVTQGWKRVVAVREPNGGTDVAIFLKQDRDEVVQGLVITVIDGGNEAVLVNVVGNVKLEQIASLGERLNIPKLAQLNLPKD